MGKAYKFFKQDILQKQRKYTLTKYFAALFNYIFPTDFHMQPRDVFDNCYQEDLSVLDYLRQLQDLADRWQWCHAHVLALLQAIPEIKTYWDIPNKYCKYDPDDDDNSSGDDDDPTYHLEGNCIRSHGKVILEVEDPSEWLEGEDTPNFARTLENQQDSDVTDWQLPQSMDCLILHSTFYDFLD